MTKVTGWSEGCGPTSKPLSDPSAVQELAELLNSLGEAASQSERERIRQEIDEVVFKVFGIYAGERVLIRDVLRTSVDFVHNHDRSAAIAMPSPNDLAEYAKAFVTVFGPIANGAKRRLDWTVYAGTGPLRVVSIRLKPGRGSRRIDSSKVLDEVLAELSTLLWQRDGVNVYRRRHMRVFEDDAVHIVKPAQLRFWTPSTAFHDADEALAQSLTETA